MPSKEGGKVQVERKEQNGNHPGKGGGFGRKLPALFGSLAIALGIYVASKTRATTVPESYAICSKKGNKVYTVDDENSQTQCVVVSGAYIVDTGSLGT